MVNDKNQNSRRNQQTTCKKINSFVLPNLTHAPSENKSPQNGGFSHVSPRSRGFFNTFIQPHFSPLETFRPSGGVNVPPRLSAPCRGFFGLPITSIFLQGIYGNSNFCLKKAQFLSLFYDVPSARAQYLSESRKSRKSRESCESRNIKIRPPKVVRA